MPTAVFITLVSLLFHLMTYCDAQAKSRHSNVQSPQLHLTFDIFIGGFEAGHIELSARIQGSRYDLYAITSSAGLIDYLIGFRSYAQTRGERKTRKLNPISHHVNNLWTGDIRFVRMGYVDVTQTFDGPEFTVIHPLPHLDDREIVPEIMRRNTIDPLSAALRAAYAAKGWGGQPPCEDTIPVFDGHRRYDLVFMNSGTEMIEGPYYKGSARKCLTSIRRIVGFSRNPFLPRSCPAEWCKSVALYAAPGG